MKTLSERVEGVREDMQIIIDASDCDLACELAQDAIESLPSAEKTEDELCAIVQKQIDALPCGKTYDPVMFTVCALKDAGMLLVRK